MYWENGKPQSGEFLIDDHNPGYDTKGASMIRVPRFGGASDPAFILTGETSQGRRTAARRTGADADRSSAVRARHGESVLGEADGLRHCRAL